MRLERRDNRIVLGGRTVEPNVTFLGEPSPKIGYASVDDLGGGRLRGLIAERNGSLACRIIDTWGKLDRGIRLERELVSGDDSSRPSGGINAGLTVRIGEGSWRFFIPAACYDYCPNEADAGYAIVSEERISAPLVMAYDQASRQVIILMRARPARSSKPRAREPGAQEFLHAAETGGLGFRRGAATDAALISCVPYAEAPSSRMLGKSLAAFTAFLPGTPQQRIFVSYTIVTTEAEAFDAACFLAYKLFYEVFRPESAGPSVDLAECVMARTGCLAGLVRGWQGYTGLNLNFDPRVGMDAPPCGYGTAFNTLESSVFPRVLEYGFTGRQLNNAFMLATLGGLHARPAWVDAAARVTRSFLESCTTPTGFLNTLYDVDRRRAISPFGDPVGSLLHYGVHDAPSGNYVRNMAEAGFDLCLLHRAMPNPGILKAAQRLGRFFLRAQNPDGSWFRAYTESGEAIRRPEEWFGGSERANKSSTSAVIPFLVRLHDVTGERAYLSSARKAGDWLMEEMILKIDYRGGTLDNPNIVDKEGMAYPMTALVDLFQATHDATYADGAVRAGGLALTWNCLWDVPFEEGTRLHACSFLSRGWGGISILWGAGVVDNYSLWFLPGWLRLSELTGNSVFRDVAMLVLHGTQQLLSLPGRMHDLIGVGMQEEGFACSDQGVDEGMIRKGDTWGALGWVFAAGTYGVWQALQISRQLASPSQ